VRFETCRCVKNAFAAAACSALQDPIVGFRKWGRGMERAKEGKGTEGGGKEGEKREVFASSALWGIDAPARKCHHYPESHNTTTSQKLKKTTASHPELTTQQFPETEYFWALPSGQDSVQIGPDSAAQYNGLFSYRHSRQTNTEKNVSLIHSVALLINFTNGPYAAASIYSTHFNPALCHCHWVIFRWRVLRGCIVDLLCCGFGGVLGRLELGRGEMR